MYGAKLADQIRNPKAEPVMSAPRKKAWTHLLSKPAAAWAIVHDGDVLIWTIRSTRKDSIKEVEFNWAKKWRKLKKEGCRASKIRISPVG